MGGVGGGAVEALTTNKIDKSRWGVPGASDMAVKEKHELVS